MVFVALQDADSKISNKFKVRKQHLMLEVITLVSIQCLKQQSKIDITIPVLQMRKLRLTKVPIYSGKPRFYHIYGAVYLCFSS